MQVPLRAPKTSSKKRSLSSTSDRDGRSRCPRGPGDRGGHGPSRFCGGSPCAVLLQIILHSRHRTRPHCFICGQHRPYLLNIVVLLQRAGCISSIYRSIQVRSCRHMCQQKVAARTARHRRTCRPPQPALVPHRQRHCRRRKMRTATGMVNLMACLNWCRNC